jgi:transcriptional regulator with XRE-family HTH domain
MTKTLGDFVRERRDGLDLSLREFAKKLGNVSPAHISDIENGRRHPSDELLKRMAPILKVAFEEIQKHDLRPPVDELRRMVQRNPTYGVALRKLTEKNVDADALVKFLDDKGKKH